MFMLVCGLGRDVRSNMTFNSVVAGRAVTCYIRVLIKMGAAKRIFSYEYVNYNDTYVSVYT